MHKENSSYVVRYAKISDWPTIYNLMSRFFVELTHNQLSYIIYMATHKNNLFVVSKHSVLAGLISLNPHKNNVTWIDYLIIDSEHRNQGLASKLLEKVFEMTNEQNTERFNLAVLKDNYPAIQLYNKHGFEYAYEERDKIILSRFVRKHDHPSDSGIAHKSNPSIAHKIFYRIYFLYIWLAINVKRKPA